MVSDARCQKKCQLFPTLRPGCQEGLGESHFPNFSRSSQIFPFHLSNSQCFLINAFTLECGRELGYNQSADHMAILLQQPQIAGHGQRLPYQSYKLSCCSSSACPLLNPFPRLPDVNYFTTFLLNPLQLQPQGNGER